MVAPFVVGLTSLVVAAVRVPLDDFVADGSKMLVPFPLWLGR